MRLRGLRSLKLGHFDAALLDVLMPETDGVQGLPRIHAIKPDLPVIMLSGSVDIGHIMGSVHRGAAEYFPKNWPMEMLVSELRSVIDWQRTSVVKADPNPFEGIAGSSPVMSRLREQAANAAKLGPPILVLGETGTGKDLLVRCIHAARRGARRYFVPVGCGTLANDGLEEMYRRCLKNGGTLHLDKVGDLSIPVQVTLCRLLDEARNATPPVVQIIGTSCADVDGLARDRTLLPGLLDRLDAIRLVVPPVRERPGDIPLLVRHFLARHDAARRFRLDRAARQALERYSWPRNVREIANVVTGILARKLSNARVIHLGDLPEALRASDERSEIEGALGATGGNVSATAKLLGMHSPKLRRRMKALGIDPNDFRDR